MNISSQDSPSQIVFKSMTYDLLQTPKRSSNQRYYSQELEIIHTPIQYSNKSVNFLQPSMNLFRKRDYLIPKKIEINLSSSQQSQIIQPQIIEIDSSPKIFQPKTIIKSKLISQISSSIKYCKCVKSDCAKGYCQCFKLGNKCSNLCYCVNCSNKCDTVDKIKYPIMCNCQKNMCSKNYCNCRGSGIKCSLLCNCIQCLNQRPINKTVKKTVKSSNDL